jgi:hypothetical protein
MPIAHAGHWLTNIAYFLPVVVFIVWLAITQIKERRRSRGLGPGELTGRRDDLGDEGREVL